MSETVNYWEEIVKNFVLDFKKELSFATLFHFCLPRMQFEVTYNILISRPQHYAELHKLRQYPW